jgi:hypothetical protein
MMELDQRDNYRELFELSTDEKAHFDRIMDYLPQRLKDSLDEKLLSIYFIKNLAGAGMADWVLAKDQEILNYILLNPRLLEEDLSYWLTYREGSMLQSTGLTLKITLEGDVNTALLYALLNQGAHILDYQEGISSFIEEDFDQHFGQRTSSDFSQGVWDTNREPLQEWAIPHRDEFVPYGLGEPLVIDRAGLFDILEAWKRGPFVSLYASLSMAEDWADWYTLTWLTQIQGYTYYWELLDGEKSLWRVEPLAKFYTRPLEYLDTTEVPSSISQETSSGQAP